jgi:arginyl-tRNA synthetase
MQELQAAVKEAVKKLFSVDVEPELTRPEEQFGDYTTNIAMQLDGNTAKPPREIAKRLAGELRKLPEVAEVTVAGPGFLNVFLTNKALAKATWSATNLPRPNEGQEILVEFGDPNPFKEMHIGHLYSYIVGDAISSLLEASGATVRRLSYHGDVGLHVAMAIWGMQKDGVVPNGASKVTKQSIGAYYAKGHQAYENDENAKSEIKEINERLYKRDSETLNKLHEWGAKNSFAYFEDILQSLDIKTDKRYLESQAAAAGLEVVKKNTGSVFKESQGAIVYEGEKVGLHTRVFITGKGLPTYEAKDLGLAKLKDKDYPEATMSIIITAHEQSDYFKVMLAALNEIDSQLAAKTLHLYHGFLSLSTGKMSSRTGEVYTATKLMGDVNNEAKKLKLNAGPGVEHGAIKYGFLRHRLGSDVVYDPAESASLEGNSGPYLQYAHARARSILAKASGNKSAANASNFNPAERSLARKISQYPEIATHATSEFLPSHICTYLYELAQNFNSFYEKNRVIGDPRQAVRLKLVGAYADVLKHGLNLLNISAPDKM